MGNIRPGARRTTVVINPEVGDRIKATGLSLTKLIELGVSAAEGRLVMTEPPDMRAILDQLQVLVSEQRSAMLPP
jgi:hypothetical protein